MDINMSEEQPKARVLSPSLCIQPRMQLFDYQDIYPRLQYLQQQGQMAFERPLQESLQKLQQGLNKVPNLGSADLALGLMKALLQKSLVEDNKINVLLVQKYLQQQVANLKTEALKKNILPILNTLQKNLKNIQLNMPKATEQLTVDSHNNGGSLAFAFYVDHIDEVVKDQRLHSANLALVDNKKRVKRQFYQWSHNTDIAKQGLYVSSHESIAVTEQLKTGKIQHIITGSCMFSSEQVRAITATGKVYQACNPKSMCKYIPKDGPLKQLEFDEQLSPYEQLTFVERWSTIQQVLQLCHPSDQPVVLHFNTPVTAYKLYLKAFYDDGLLSQALYQQWLSKVEERSQLHLAKEQAMCELLREKLGVNLILQVEDPLQQLTDELLLNRDNRVAQLAVTLQQDPLYGAGFNGAEPDYQTLIAKNYALVYRHINNLATQKNALVVAVEDHNEKAIFDAYRLAEGDAPIADNHIVPLYPLLPVAPTQVVADKVRLEDKLYFVPAFVDDIQKSQVYQALKPYVDEEILAMARVDALEKKPSNHLPDPVVMCCTSSETIKSSATMVPDTVS